MRRGKRVTTGVEPYEDPEVQIFVIPTEPAEKPIEVDWPIPEYTPVQAPERKENVANQLPRSIRR